MTAQETAQATAPTQDSVFDRVRMGYMAINSDKLDEWKRFLLDGIGLALVEESGNHLAFRMDAHARRILVQRGSEEDIGAIGWQLADEDALHKVLQRLEAHNVAVTRHDGAEATERGVTAFHRFTGPKGLLVELFTEPLVEAAAPDMLCSGFITAGAGMGHISLMSREPARSVDFWQTLFDARVSDTIELGGGRRKALAVTFLRINPRHHSIAIAATNGIGIDMFRTRIQHVNLEARTLDDMMAAFARCREMGFKVARNIGQHPNDLELSFYVRTPSGFDLEIGWNALTVDEDTWEHGRSYDVMSTWGHDVPGLLGSEVEFSHLVNAAKSLTRKEYFPW